jgi:transcriptional regulator with XRE-family HTH domain
MIIGTKVKESLLGRFGPSKNREVLSPGESVRLARELLNLSQNELAALTGLPQSTISGIESGRIKLGVERSKVLARALKVHPAVLVFSDWAHHPKAA